ncbi:hypothetical protein [Methanolobus sp. WCC5]|uniref:hypothetical protein n=1 Tax=Methanolobus sp. WCC5 TaxID=3125785 RepID=UPI00325663DF
MRIKNRTPAFYSAFVVLLLILGLPFASAGEDTLIAKTHSDPFGDFELSDIPDGDYNITTVKLLGSPMNMWIKGSAAINISDGQSSITDIVIQMSSDNAEDSEAINATISSAILSSLDGNCSITGKTVA